MEGSTRERNWISTAKRPLESLCMRETGEIFDCDKGLEPSSFFKEGSITILELDSLSNDDKTFLIEIILQWIRDWLLVNNKREQLVGVIILEEAHHVLNREKTKKFGVETVTDLIFREVRELGIGVIYVDQHPSLVSYPALGNTSTHVYMNLGLDTKYSSDVQDASSMLGLREESDIDYIRRLPIGHGFILIRKSVFPNTFLIKFPLMQIKKGSVTDDMIREAMGIKLMEELKMKTVIKEQISPKAFVKNIVKRQAVEKRVKEVNSRGWEIMKILANAEAVCTSEIYKKLRMSHRVFSEQVKELIELGFVNSRKGNVYKQTAVYYFLTGDGELAFTFKTGKKPEDEKIDIEKMKDSIVNVLTLKGWSIVEKQDGYLIFEEKGMKRMVNIKTVMDKKEIFKNIEKCVVDGEIYFVCSTEKIKNAVIQQAAKYTFEHRGMNVMVFVATLEELMDKNFKKVEFSVR
jgi:virulence-associated protein VapD